jgi:AraC-like DNA-binding protein
VVSRLHISKRTMQRLFSQYVGVSPKWVIKRYRLHDAAEQVASGSIEDWARLAAELGYFDQAHFIKDFKKLVGQTPGEYARMLGVVD